MYRTPSPVSPKTKSIALYSVICTTIGIWWALAFSNVPSFLPEQNRHPLQAEATVSSTDLCSHVRREDLRQALQGDYSLMAELLKDWDLNAELWQQAGVEGVQRMDRSAWLEAQKLARALADEARAEIFREEYQLREVSDDQGVVHSFAKAPKRFITQTYASAELLLALVDPEQVVAIPAGLRTQNHAFDSELYSSVLLDADRYEAERIFLASPQLAFIASYSLPSTREVFRQQKIPLFTLDQLSEVDEICSAVERVGQACQRPLKGRLLSLFIQGALLAMDNQLVAQGKERPRLLYLRRYDAYSVPSSRYLSSRLLQRLGVSDLLGEKTRDVQWSLPLSREEIVSLQPECIVLASSSEDALHALLADPAFSELPAVCAGRVYAVDATCQDDPSQFFLLGYYDLWDALIQDGVRS